MTADNSTHFGFRNVDKSEKAPLVRGVFSSVAAKYDVMNDFMSMGVHRLWKDALIDWMKPRGGRDYLDVAGGTGDISFRILDNLRHRGETANVTVLDLTEDMLIEGRARAQKAGRPEQQDGTLKWTAGDAMQLPLPSNSMDCYTIAFGLRNVTEPETALREAARVLRPGGRFFCLEFSKVVLPVLDDIYDSYSFHVIPQIGQLVAGDRDSYQYLVESIRKFPPQDDLAQMMTDAGFSNVSYRNLSGGIVAIHSGWII